MKALNLNRLNVRTPYSVWLVGKHSYRFKTAYDVNTVLDSSLTKLFGNMELMSLTL